jgi:methyl-accepting chemotaxis protein
MLDRLKINSKLSILCATFLLPIALLVYQFIVQANVNIVFSERELVGSRYFHVLRESLDATVDLALGKADAAGATRALAAAKAKDAESAAEMKAVESADAMQKAVSAAIAAPHGDALGKALEAILAHITRVQDGSNLTLDPDLDSYYLQDLVTVKLPAAEASALQTLAVAEKMAATRPAPTALLVEFVSRKGELAAVLDGIDADVTAGLRGNADGKMKAALDASTTAFAKAKSGFTERLDALTAEVAPPSAADLRQAQKALHEANRALSVAATVELDRLLLARIDTLSTKRNGDLFGSLFVLIGSFFAAWWIGRNVSRPIHGISAALAQLAQANYEVTVPHTERGDEIGTIAKAVDTWRKNALVRKQAAQEAEKERKVREERALRVEALTLEFNEQMRSSIGNFLEAAQGLEATSASMSEVAERTSSQTSAVAGAAQESSQSVDSVATATEQMNMSISEIARRIDEADTVVKQAADQTAHAETLVTGLEETAQKIGEVVQMINDVASQTNLLALNATIEAARAGEMGKGFAVVAGEVKNLANQTARATEEISGQVLAVQEASQTTAKEIAAISQVMSSVTSITASVAAAVEEQQATTADIARSIALAASSAQEVSQNIAGLDEGAQETGEASRSVQKAAKALSQQSDAMKDNVERFIAAVRSV